MMKSSRFQKQGDSPCHVGAGLSVQFFENENYVPNYKMDGPIDTGNTEFPNMRAQDSSRKTFLTESQNYQNRYQQISMKNQLCQCK